jgi:hypothetical protein
MPPRFDLFIAPRDDSKSHPQICADFHRFSGIADARIATPFLICENPGKSVDLPFIP